MKALTKKEKAEFDKYCDDVKFIKRMTARLNRAGMRHSEVVLTMNAKASITYSLYLQGEHYLSFDIQEECEEYTMMKIKQYKEERGE